MLQAPWLDIGTYIGRFRVIRPLGAGGMAAIYECLDERLRHRVAIKVLHRDLAYVAEWRGRLLGEGQVANMLSHPAFVAVQEDGELPDGRRYLVMELLQGETLAQCLTRVGRGPDRTEFAVRIGKQIAAAMVVAHQGGIIHRDLKPENLFLVDDAELPGGKRVRILDFGIAQSSAHDQLGMQPRRALGTPGYMAPEQILGCHDVNGSADVYSLGVILFELLTGCRPFMSDSPEQELRAQLHRGAPQPPSQIPPRLRVLLSRMLMMNRSYRPQMTEVQAELQAIVTSSVADTSIKALTEGRIPRWQQMGMAAFILATTLLFFTLQFAASGISLSRTPSPGKVAHNVRPKNGPESGLARSAYRTPNAEPATD